MNPKKKFKWSSHNPVIMAALDLMRPQLIVELGVGNFSTPLMLASDAQKTIHIENDQAWLDEMHKTFPNTERSDFRLHAIADNVNKATPLLHLLPDTISQCRTYYQDLLQEIRELEFNPSLLFVDHFTCVRTMSINLLASDFDFVIYHDAEYPEIYGYETIDKQLSTVFDHLILKTRSSWTGFLCKKNLLDREMLRLTVLKKADEFGKQYGEGFSDFAVEDVW